MGFCGVGMKRPNPMSSSGEQVNVSSDDDSSCDEVDAAFLQPKHRAIIHQFAQVTEEDELLRRAEIYQEYMKRLAIPLHRGSVVPFTSWTELGESLKQLYGQPLHYLTNIQLKQLDRLRIDASDEDIPLDTLIPPPKAEATIWLMEEVHRLSSSHHQLAKLWFDNPMHHAFIDPLFPDLAEVISLTFDLALPSMYKITSVEDL